MSATREWCGAEKIVGVRLWVAARRSCPLTARQSTAALRQCKRTLPFLLQTF